VIAMKIFPKSANWAERPVWLFIYAVVLAVCAAVSILEKGLL